MRLSRSSPASTACTVNCDTERSGPQSDWRRNLRAGAALVAVLVATGALDLAARAEPACTCRAAGRSFELGQSVCLKTPAGPRIAVCVMVLNNTSWQISATPCVSADAGDRPPYRTGAGLGSASARNIATPRPFAGSALAFSARKQQRIVLE